MQTGSREFAAYAQTLRRTYLAKLLERSAEALAATERPRDVYDFLIGGLAVEPLPVAKRSPHRPHSAR